MISAPTLSESTCEYMSHVPQQAVGWNFCSLSLLRWASVVPLLRGAQLLLIRVVPQRTLWPCWQVLSCSCQRLRCTTNGCSVCHLFGPDRPTPKSKCSNLTFLFFVLFLLFLLVCSADFIALLKKVPGSRSSRSQIQSTHYA